MKIKIVISFVGVVGGIMSGVGVLGLLQQAGSVYPTRNVLVLAAVLGALWGIALPSLTFTRAVRAAHRG